MKSRFYAVAHFLLAWLVRVVFLAFSKNRKNEPRRSEGPYIVCSNHLSAIDPIIICACTRRQQPRYMAKKELFEIPVLSLCIKAVGAYPVDRTGNDAGVVLKTVRMLNEGCSIGMFPQGTRRPGVDPADTPVRSGVGFICSRTQAQVLPVYLKVRGNRMGFLRPVKVIFGRPVKYDEYTGGGEHENDAAYISKYIFDRVCELGREGGGTELKNEPGA